MCVDVELLWTGEDGTELSAAGQMETVLGVKGLDQVSVALHTLVLSLVLKIICFNPVPSPSNKNLDQVMHAIV